MKGCKLEEESKTQAAKLEDLASQAKVNQDEVDCDSDVRGAEVKEV